MKPKFLYHASSKKNLIIVKPYKKSYRDLKEGPLVFATPDMAYACCFLVPTNDSWTRISRFGKDSSWNMIISDKNRFLKSDKGGAIYFLPVRKFSCDLNKGTKESEWTSKAPVKPIKKIIYESGLVAMLKNGVRVFFVSSNIFRQIKKAKDHGRSIISNLTPCNRIKKTIIGKRRP